MKPFYDTWESSIHGKTTKGVVVAECVDCHLPQEDVLEIVFTKAHSGVKDYISHYTKAEINWNERLTNHKPDKYEKGCKKCHKDLDAPGIPLKAFKAHRRYTLNETEKSCTSCHSGVGHANLITAIKKIGIKEGI
ncbi:MAG: hypothetical protein D6828_02365 [Nitrospirae bacterium]|nr:MAG: hypothetical protein D6828_02365 [Nitrospirota bacterium]